MCVSVGQPMLIHFLRAIATSMVIVVTVQVEAQEEDPLALQRARSLMLENVGYFLDGAVEVDMEEGVVDWSMTERQVKQKMERIVLDVQSLQSLESLKSFRNFSSEVQVLIAEVSTLTYRDLRRWRMAEGLSDAEQWYVLVQSSLEELKMQVAMELNLHFNAVLYHELDRAVTDWRNSNIESEDWREVDPEALLPPIDWVASDVTRALLSGEDGSSWDDVQGSGETSESMQWWMDRVLDMLENQDRRLSLLEGQDVIERDPERFKPISMDPRLQNLHLPASLDIRFVSGSHALGLNSQMQLNEIMEILGRYPQIRVVCTGHADASGDRAPNYQLSKRRAQAVRSYLLQSGVTNDRVLLNFFGEERGRQSGSEDRRVEVTFYVE